MFQVPKNAIYKSITRRKFLELGGGAATATERTVSPRRRHALAGELQRGGQRQQRREHDGVDG
jgi:hypothetical protein